MNDEQVGTGSGTLQLDKKVTCAVLVHDRIANARSALSRQLSAPRTTCSLATIRAACDGSAFSQRLPDNLK